MEASSDDGRLQELEPVVNQWVLDYFFHLYVDAFKNCRNNDFEQIRNIVSNLIDLRLKCVEQNSRTILMMRLLSCINEDCRFEENKNETPLESAIEVLDMMHQEESFPADLINTNKQMVKEAAVVYCIQKKQFSRARSILKKHITNSKNTRLRAELLQIIKEQNVKHPLIANFSFCTVKEKIYDMFKNHVQDIPSFLLNLAKKDLADLNVESKEPQTPDKQSEQSPRNVSSQDKSSTPNHISPGSQKKDVTSSELDVGKEASVVAEMGQRRCLVSLHQLVMEQESQQDSEMEEETTLEMESPRRSPRNAQRQKRSNESVQTLFNSPAASKKRKTLAVSDKPSVVEEQDTWSDEDNLFQDKRSSESTNSTSSLNKRKKWTKEETEWIRLGVELFGEGKWIQILKKYPFKERTAVAIKDRFRTMKKLSLV